MLLLMYSSAFYSVELQACNLKSPNLSLNEVYNTARSRDVTWKFHFGTILVHIILSVL
jgi:hypothetical protein